jgi:hypothetical protein
MINAKVKIFNAEFPSGLESSINEFLETIDVRQIIKTEYSSSVSAGPHQIIKTNSAVIYYVELSDVRDAKIDNVLEIK